MECPKCGASMELVMYSDDTGDYFTWVCYVCGAELGDKATGLFD